MTPLPPVQAGLEVPDRSADEGLLADIRRLRAHAALAPQGALALANTQWITGDPARRQPIWGVAGLWSPLPPGVSGLRLTASAADGIVVDGVRVDGDVAVAGLDSAAPADIRFSDTLTGTVIASEEGDYALRVWDADADAIRDFGCIAAFPYDPAWSVEATFTSNADADEVSLAYLNEAGKTAEKARPGEVTFTLHGRQRRLVAFRDGAFEHGSSLLIVFADKTTGDTTYSVGRFLRVVADDAGAVTLDFNRAYLPPCAFSYNFNCPIPPAQNRLDVAVTAGERNVLDRKGELLH